MRSMKRFLTGLVLALLFPGPAIFAKDSAPRPNIVMIISDDQAWNDYSFMGHEQIRTPHLDKLASESLLFRRGYVPSSLCCPSLVSIITGQYPRKHRITSNDPPLPEGLTGRAANKDPEFLRQRQRFISFMDDLPTLPKILGEHGYLSFQTGKWWQGHYNRGGFTHGMTSGDPAKGGRHGDEGLSIGRKSMQPIYDFIDTAQREEKPFMVWYAPLLPHDPHTPPDRLLQKYINKTDSIHVARYWAMVEWFDETCGELMEHLDKRNLRENTIVVYVTDNGWIQNPDAPKYAPKSKQSQYDGGVRTPIMIRWPARVKPQDSRHMALSLDLMPTLLTALNIEPPKGLPGTNLLDASAVRKRKAIFGECFTHNAVDIEKPLSSLRWSWAIEGDWKLILPNPRNEPDGVVELYNLKKDPFEVMNLAAKEPRRVKALARLIENGPCPMPNGSLAQGR